MVQAKNFNANVLKFLHLQKTITEQKNIQRYVHTRFKKHNTQF
jgi:hypothetical protein